MAHRLCHLTIDFKYNIDFNYLHHCCPKLKTVTVLMADPVYRWIRTPPYQRAIEYKPEKDRRMKMEEMAEEDRNWVVDNIRGRKMI
jgi:hypothetical protein